MCAIIEQYTLRSYQSDAVKETIRYFSKNDEPGVLVLPTGAGKSLVIAELARLSKGRVLVLAPSKELVKQNHEKYESYGLKGSIYSAGLGRRETTGNVIFATVQSVYQNLDDFYEEFSLIVIDECHGVSMEETTRYQQVFKSLKRTSPFLNILGLTATPYRLKDGWIYQYHHQGEVKSKDYRFFKDCIFELPLRYLLDQKYLSPFEIIDVPLFSYDFSRLKPASTGKYKDSELNMVIDTEQLKTPQIVGQILKQAEDKNGVMIFAATVDHAKTIYSLMPCGETALILGETPKVERDTTIEEFKQRKLKYIINVGVLTQGFDASHVDLIAILRPTESVSLYQQIVGRGLRLDVDKEFCLVLDYAGNAYDIYNPEIGNPKPDPNAVIVNVKCPQCGFKNKFWGYLDEDGNVLKHTGKRCQGFTENSKTNKRTHCDYEFKETLTRNRTSTPEERLKEAFNLKDNLVFECRGMWLTVKQLGDNIPQLRVTYTGGDGEEIYEDWKLETKQHRKEFKDKFLQKHLIISNEDYLITTAKKVASHQHLFRKPSFIIAKSFGDTWKLRDRIFKEDLTS